MDQFDLKWTGISNDCFDVIYLCAMFNLSYNWPNIMTSWFQINSMLGHGSGNRVTSVTRCHGLSSSLHIIKWIYDGQ